eukprot:106622_1
MHIIYALCVGFVCKVVPVTKQAQTCNAISPQGTCHRCWLDLSSFLSDASNGYITALWTNSITILSLSEMKPMLNSTRRPRSPCYRALVASVSCFDSLGDSLIAVSLEL